MTVLSTLFESLHLEPLPDPADYLDGFDAFQTGRPQPESKAGLTGWLDADRLDAWREEARREFANGSDE